jgi:hypothetical protein
MRTLVYKRTHVGDPNESGRFGCNECTGWVRTWDFDAVIGIGGIGQEPIDEGIARRVTWIGINRHQVGKAADEFPIWAFEKFYLKDKKGPFLDENGLLAKRLFRKKHPPRRLIIDSETSPEAEEVDSLLWLARKAEPSPAMLGKKVKAKKVPLCPPRKKLC